MSKRSIFFLTALAVIIIFIGIISTLSNRDDGFSEIVKISLRDAGNQLLLSNKDSTSLILPVVKLKNAKYRLSFEDSLAIMPGSLVSILKGSFRQAELPNFYRVEVIPCEQQEVAYSYEVKGETEKDIIPCGSRGLKSNCYAIEVRFTRQNTSFFNIKTAWYVFGFILLVGALGFLYNRKRQTTLLEKGNENYLAIGNYKFYPDQNKLVKEAIEIGLSKKECELLAIFVSNPNQIIKRDELTKKVWEDNGVIVGRSLDTYISKLRKKLKDDNSIRLTNVHGVGYKLEMTS